MYECLQIWSFTFLTILQEFMGVFLGSAVVPIALCVTWSKANKNGCIAGALGGFAAGITAWLVTTSTLNNSTINVTTSGGDYEMLAGNLASIGVGGIIAVVASLIWPDNYDFAGTRAINTPQARIAAEAVEEEDDEKKDEKMHSVPYATEVSSMEVDPDLDPVVLNKAFVFAARASIVLVSKLIPLTVYSSDPFSDFRLSSLLF